MREAAPPTLEAVREPVRERLAAVPGLLAEIAASEFGDVEDVTRYLLDTRGKLLRPTLVLLANEVGGEPAEEAVRVAALVELVHLATLVHDDAVDHSVRRRGMPTVNSRWSHQVAVIMGDYLYSRAVTEITRLGRLEAVAVLARAANRMAVGEMRQVASHDRLAFGEEEYYRLCECKTASLLAAACELGAMFGRTELREPLRRFGHDLGMAFQITDDLLDYTASQRETGKPTGLDLREHKVTLPLIAALPRLEREERARVEELFGDPDPPDARVEEVIAIVDRAGGLAYARERAAHFAERASDHLAGLPREPATEAFRLSLDFVVSRRS